MSTEQLKAWWGAARDITEYLKSLDSIRKSREALANPGYKVHLGGNLTVTMYQDTGTFSAEGEVLAVAMNKVLDAREVEAKACLQKATLAMYQITHSDCEIPPLALSPAPELLEVVKQMQSALSRCFGAHSSDEGDRHRALATARAIIGKATGENK